MSGNQPPDPPSGDTPQFPTIGQYDLVPEPGEPGYVDPEAEAQALEELEDALDDGEDSAETYDEDAGDTDDE